MTLTRKNRLFRSIAYFESDLGVIEVLGTLVFCWGGGGVFIEYQGRLRLSTRFICVISVRLPLTATVLSVGQISPPPISPHPLHNLGL